MQLLQKVLWCGLTSTFIIVTWLLVFDFDPKWPAMKWKYEFNTNTNSVWPLITTTLSEVNVNNSTVSSESETFVPQNPCTKIEKNQSSFLGKRLAKCTTKVESIMMTCEGGGRLGNQMFSYASLFAISRYNDRKAWMSPLLSNFISKYFNVSSDTISPTIFNRIKWRHMELRGRVPDAIRKLDGNKAPYLQFHGPTHVRQYFHEIRPLILKEFRFYDHIVQNSKLKLLEIKRKYFEESDPVTMVGIHVRRGDYLKFTVGLRFFNQTVEFYVGAMRHFTRKYKNVIFVVASNDVRWCKENLLSLTDFRVQILQGVPEEDAGLDLAVLVHCDHVIYGLGTFGFWAGYLSPGEVIYCSDCITPSTSWLTSVYGGDYANCVLPYMDWVF